VTVIGELTQSFVMFGVPTHIRAQVFGDFLEVINDCANVGVLGGCSGGGFIDLVGTCDKTP